MARKRRPSKNMGNIYLILFVIVLIIIGKIIEVIKAIPWQFWASAFCVLFLFFIYRHKKATSNRQSSPVHKEQPKPAIAPSPVPSHSNAIAKADSAMQPDAALPHQSGQHLEDVINVSPTDLMISGTSAPLKTTVLNANSFVSPKPSVPVSGPPAIDDDDDDIFTTVGMTDRDSQSQAPEFCISFTFEDRSLSDMGLSQQNPLFSPSELMPAGPSMVGRWMSPGEEITLAGLKISGGMFYVGNSRLDGGLIEEPSLIDPQALVTINNPPSNLNLHGYYPSYKNLSADAKKRYLQWLADGRKDSDASIGFVFIFFYGLERRFFIDAKRDELAKREMPFILAEVARLLAIYSSHPSFARYATNFLEYGLAKSISKEYYLLPAPEAEPFCYHIPIALKICLGQLVRDGKPLPSDWALLWATSIPTISLRTPAQRCFELFKALFIETYQREFGDGIQLKELKSRVEVSYAPSSYVVSQYSERCVTNLSDVSFSQPYIRKLSQVIDTCTNILEPYSRYLGRNIGSENTLEALLHLPYQYWPAAVKQPFAALQEEVGDQPMLMSWSDFAVRINSAGNLNKAQYEGLATILAHHHMSIEPHPEGSNKRPKGDEPVVIYPISPLNKPDSYPSIMASASVFVELACIVLNTDEDKSELTIAFLKEQIGAMSFLAPLQSVRLMAKALLNTQVPPTLSVVKKTLDGMDDEQKALVGKLLVAFVKADNSINPAKVKVLEQLYKLLSLDVKQVYSDLHSNEARIVSTSQSSSVAKVRSNTSGLDMDRVAQLKQETAQVTAILASVFTENDDDHADHHQPLQAKTEETSDQAHEPTPPGNTQSLLGLDDDLSKFLRALLVRPEWARDELSALADAMGLMLDGALEQINEVMLDHFDEMLIEGDDPIEVNFDLLEQIHHE